MKIIKKSKEIHDLFKSFNHIGFVPTMGYLHKGHVSLIKQSLKENKNTIVSIFVNPKQFNNKKDLKKYPKSQNSDIKVCKQLGVNYLFIPNYNEVYKWKTKKYKYPKIVNFMEHQFRKGHFKGVLMVIEKLLNIIPAKRIYLGEKDYQQLTIIKDFIKINKIKSSVVACKTVRDRGGLALSSRNKFLKTINKNTAARVYKLIKEYKKNYKNKRFEINNLMKWFEKNKLKFDYIENINIKKFKREGKVTKNSRIFIAYYLNNIRLIDNI